MVIVFALAAAVLYGSADFLGGLASRHTRALSVLTVSVPAGSAALVVAALAAGAQARSAGLGWALAGGAIGGAGMIVFYAGLAAGPMSVVAPVSALVATVLPVGAALASGERPSLAVGAGAVLCLVAIGLVSMEHGARRRRVRHAVLRGLAYGSGSGAAFGIFFLFLRYAGESGLLWPVCAARASGSAIILGAAAWPAIRSGRPGIRSGGSSAGHRVLVAAAAAGLLDAGANVFYVLATRAGLFGMAVVLTSLYPGITVLLARVVLGERMRAVQRLGLVIAALGVMLVVA